MTENIKKSTNFTIGCTSWTGVILSAVIIAVRAFQPGATPVETWSIGSWALMLLPVFLPLVIWPIVIVVGLLWAIASALCSSKSSF